MLLGEIVSPSSVFHTQNLDAKLSGSRERRAAEQQTYDGLGRGNTGRTTPRNRNKAREECSDEIEIEAARRL